VTAAPAAETGTIKLLLVDDHPVFRMGLRDLLQNDPTITVVGEAGTGDEALEQVRRLSPDVVLMDLRMPNKDGIETTRQIKAEAPDTQVVVLTAFDDDNDVVGAYEAGVSGYLLKGDDLDALLRTIHNACSGRIQLGPTIAKRMLERLAAAPPAPPRTPVRQPKSELTPRELAVLRLIAQGKKNREVASILGISERTVADHQSNIFSRLRLHRRTEAILYAIRKGLVT